MIQVRVMAVGVEPTSKWPFVLLKDDEGGMVLPIGIGFFEANQISMKLENREPPRPMPYDLLRSILEQLGVTVEKVVVNALAQNTFFALITLKVDGQTLEIDSRPSDAIALALRVQAPIYVAEEVMEEAGVQMREQEDIQLESTPEGEAEVPATTEEEEELDKRIGVLR
ncbi:MAG: bifunctional nuclease family protein, partial [Candidatus Latescibacterota bacterium]